ncbi:hypothetical protein ON010_g12162 [Phytophthora cinnamomi]|nr:hypothetical protein ON010_g12162 [Phytophthora cinnamomi]
MNASNHVAPNARLNNDNYKTWRAEMCTILDASNLLPPLLGDEHIEDQRNDAQRRCFQQRLRVAQREIVMALSEDLQSRFSNVIERADPLLLWRTLADHFDNRPGVNVVFLKRDMLNRRLQRNERLDNYIKDIDDFKHQLRRANQQLPEAEAVSVLLSNTVGVYPAVVNEHEVRLARGESISWEQAIERLRLAEHARLEAERQQGRDGRVVQQGVALVHNSSGNSGRGGGRRNSSFARGNRDRSNQSSRPRSPNSSLSPRGRNKRQKSKSSSRGSEDLAKRKSKSKCNACGRQGHWRNDPECPERGSNLGSGNREPARSMVSVVTVKKTVSTDSSQRGAVLAVRGRTKAQRASGDMIEWILDSGAQTSVSSDLTLFTELHEDTVSELQFGNGTTERATVGTAHTMVMNEHTGKEEERLLENVSYSKSAPYNLITQTYMQFTCGFKLRVSRDQTITWLVKDSLKLKFQYDRGMYRMWTPRQSKPVLSVSSRSVENPMALLHNRLGHVGMDTIKTMAGQAYNFGIQFQQQQFAHYECIPCVESKTKRMSYSRGPTRSAKRLEKLSVDLCSVGVDTVAKSNQFLLVVDEATRYKWDICLRPRIHQLRWSRLSFAK